MHTIRLCHNCGTPLPTDAPGGLCPQCLLKGVITNARVFRFYLQVAGGGPFQAGQYVFHRHDHMRRVADALRTGPIIVTRRLTIRCPTTTWSGPCGWRWNAVAG